MHHGVRPVAIHRAPSVGAPRYRRKAAPAFFPQLRQEQDRSLHVEPASSAQCALKCRAGAPLRRNRSRYDAMAHDSAFLLDVDNTLLDNDAVEADLERYLDREFGVASRERYWSVFEALRAEVGYADYLGALQRYRVRTPYDPRLLLMSSFLVDYPFQGRLYPGALDAIACLAAWGPTIIVSDGDVVFQPRKVQRSGLWDAVEGRVLIYIHKETMLDDIEQRYPARRYVMVDDKLRIHAAMKRIWKERLTTVFVRQGHYALDARLVASSPPADLSMERIGDLVRLDLADFLTASGEGRREDA
jgi:FMN phosphatase YigB (HAD superfamily)